MAVAVAQSKKVAIVGLPNTGKSLIFNHLTGVYTLVANYARTTVKPQRTKCDILGCRCEVIDTPGLHCLSVHSQEEFAIRDLIFNEHPDVIVQCIDANQLKQSLTLTADLLELNTPMVISLNAIDETARKGIWIDSDALSKSFGVPVVETIATEGRGISKLRRAIADAKPPRMPFRYNDVIEEAIADMQRLLPDTSAYARKAAVLLILRDPFVDQYIARIAGAEAPKQLKGRVNELALRFKGNLTTSIVSTRSRWLDDATADVVKHSQVTHGELGKTVGHLCRHPLFGIPILFLFLAATYFLVVHVAGAMSSAMNDYLALPVVGWIGQIVPAGFWRDLFVDPNYGLLTLGLFNAICTVLPILSVFFLVLGALEDMGYLPSLCVLTKRVFDKIGLNGNAVMSVILGFGCKTMATLTTSGLPRKEKLIAVYLIAAYVPCSAQMGLTMGVLGRYTFWALLATYGIVFVIAVAAGLILNRMIPDAGSDLFIQELPAIRWPDPKAVVIKTYYRLYWFLKEAVPIFVGAALILFLAYQTGLLGIFKAGLSPIVVGWLGMPLDMVDALILCVARHEAAAGLLIKMGDAGKLTEVQCILAALLTTIFVPCFANTVAIYKRLGLKTALIMTVAMNVSAIVLVGVFRWIVVFFMGMTT